MTRIDPPQGLASQWKKGLSHNILLKHQMFGSEFVAARIAVELIESLRYKLRMFGVPIDGPTNVYCDNDSVCTNSTKSESTLKKKHKAIAYHRVREAVAAGMIRVAWEPTDTNIADMLTK
jgi:hypothetical protein